MYPTILTFYISVSSSSKYYWTPIRVSSLKLFQSMIICVMKYIVVSFHSSFLFIHDLHLLIHRIRGYSSSVLSSVRFPTLFSSQTPSSLSIKTGFLSTCWTSILLPGFTGSEFILRVRQWEERKTQPQTLWSAETSFPSPLARKIFLPAPDCAALRPGCRETKINEDSPPPFSSPEGHLVLVLWPERQGFSLRFCCSTTVQFCIGTTPGLKPDDKREKKTNQEIYPQTSHSSTFGNPP